MSASAQHNPRVLQHFAMLRAISERRMFSHWSAVTGRSVMAGDNEGKTLEGQPMSASAAMRLEWLQQAFMGPHA